MTCGDFIGNLEGLNEGGDFPRELLKVGGGAGTGCWRGGVGDLLAPSEGSEVRGLPASCHRSLDSCDSAWGPTPSLEPHTPALSTCALACSGGCALRGEGRRLSKTRDQAALDPVFAFISAPPVFIEDGRDCLHGSGGHRYTASLHPLHSPATRQTVTKAILVPLRWRHPEVEEPERDKGFSKVW